MAASFTQEIFELKPLLKSIEIKLCTQNRNGVKHILALITETNEIVLYYSYGELPPVVKRIPWFSDSSKIIHAACFDPTATWLLIVCLDSSLYIIPALHIVDKKQKIDCKWSLTDVTSFPKISKSPHSHPTCCVWWQTLDCNQNALVGFNYGKILLVSLTDGKVLGECHIRDGVTKLHICFDEVKETISLLVNGDSDRQWRLILEQHCSSYVWPAEGLNSNSDDSMKSKFFSLKQIGVDTFVSLKQKLGSRKDNSNDVPIGFPQFPSGSLYKPELLDTISSCQSGMDLNGLESSNATTTFLSTENDSKHDYHDNSEPQKLPQLIDTFFTPQTYKNRNLFSALYRPSGLLTVHGADFETAPVFIYRVLPRTHSLILTDNLTFTLNKDINVISVISSQLSESRLEGEMEFNEDALVAQFMIDNEEIIDFFKVADMSVDTFPSTRNNKFSKQKVKIDTSFLKPALDTCIIVTKKTVYKIFIRYSPVQRFIDYVTEENDLEKAEKLSYVFNLNLQQLLEHCGDLMISRGSYHSGIILYKQAKVHLLKRVLKLAVSADCKTLLKFVHLCLSASRIDMNITTRIHIGNVAVMAYVELLLRTHGSEQAKVNNTKDFMTFLVHESHFDPILAVNMTCQAGHWNIVNLLSKSRGLQSETIVAFSKILQNDFCPKPTNLEFLYALSEPTLTQSLLILSHNSQIIFQYIRENINEFPMEILKRLVILLDPSQPCTTPFLKAIYQNNKDSTTDTNIESYGLDVTDYCTIVMKDMVETFLYVILSLIGRFSKINFETDQLPLVLSEITQDGGEVINRLPDLKLLSCGPEHAAVIRNNSVYTMGVATSGCLGIGPMLTNTSGPRLVNTLHDLKVVPLSVSCGRKHTLCATDCGVFSWGSNSHGQLGLGPEMQETPYPQLITSMSHLKIIDIAAGQYHNLALTMTGDVYSWGWGIHGQLGHGCCDNEYYPKLIKFNSPVKQVAAGHAHSIVLTCSGKIYGFGSNVFGQLETNSRMETKKCPRPTWIVLMPDIYVPVDKISTSYFHNMAVTADQKVYMWGASPEEVRLFQQRSSQKQGNGLSEIVAHESWKLSVQIYHSQNRRPIKQISVGFRHCAILDQGRILWGRNKDEELCQPNLKDPYEGIIGHRFAHVSCGLDYTMAIDQNGQVLAWGTPAMMETILGVSMETIRKKYDDRTLIIKGTKRTFKTPHVHPISNNLPIEISVLPSATFSFNQLTHKSLLKNKFQPHNLLLLEKDNDPSSFYGERTRVGRSDFEHIHYIPKITVTQKILHYALQCFVDLYDVENIYKKSMEYGNYQAASKVAYLHGHFVDSLGFAIEAFKRHVTELEIDVPSLFMCKDSYDLKEKDTDVDMIVKIDVDITSSCSSPAKMMSSSSSLDSIKHFGEEGGRESPCQDDIRQNVTNYVQSVNKNESMLPGKMPNMIERDMQIDKNVKGLEVKNKQAKDVLQMASRIVQFYIENVYISDNHILMQNILLRCIEFWLTYNLPITILENILLKNMDKYFYPLSILLFCKNFDEDSDIILTKTDKMPISSSRFLKEFSSKFCLHLCSMVLENANKS
ncbi:hypothetical protein ABEB36_010144 [Hypothenemus hampei]|uniref:RCC1-like domain-containing protein n=1 Tax=Hypothenemus hampei TaxID=57062 RepID=A0ABD1EJ53_HYPHA